jgi:hypothetical protein
MLRLVVAGFAAIETIIISVLHQANIVFSLAKHAIVFHFAFAPAFSLVTL